MSQHCTHTKLDNYRVHLDFPSVCHLLRCHVFPVVIVHVTSIAPRIRRQTPCSKLVPSMSSDTNAATADTSVVILDSLSAKERKKEFVHACKALKSKDAAKRLSALEKCTDVRYFKEGGCLLPLLQGISFTKVGARARFVAPTLFANEARNRVLQKSAALVQASLRTFAQVLQTAKENEREQNHSTICCHANPAQCFSRDNNIPNEQRSGKRVVCGAARALR